MNGNNRNEILDLLAEGKISAAEAARLLDSARGQPEERSSLDVKTPEPEQLKAAGQIADPGGIDDVLPVEEIKTGVKEGDGSFDTLTITKDDVSPAAKSETPRWLKIRVQDMSTGRNKVSVTLPLGLVDFGLGIARRFGADFEDEADVRDMWRMLKEGQKGMLVNVEDEEDNELVQIYLD